MGVVQNINYDNFPKQNTNGFAKVGARVRVYYGYDTSKFHEGVIVRSDDEEPFETIIKIDNGRFLRGVECQFQIME